MTYEVEIFRGSDLVPDGTLPLEPLLRRFFEKHLDQRLDGAHIQLLFLPEAEAAGSNVTLTGGFNVANLRPRYGQVQVRVLLEGELLYQHPHPVSELLGRVLRDTLTARDPGEQRWGVGLRGAQLDLRAPLERPVPDMERSTHIEVGAPRGRVFEMEEIPRQAAPLRTIADLGVDVPNAALPPPEPVTIVVDGRVYDALTQTLQFSDEVEEGGFLTGQVYRDVHAPDCHIVEVKAIMPAERTGASLLSFTFTGDSFLRVGALLAAQASGEELVGWYHTHLFAVGQGLGLSSVDVQLHRSTFRQPWQIAALVNISAGHRALRFYRTSETGMALATYWRAR
jgi:proteasome lid subunit RPN8/RPN11